MNRFIGLIDLQKFEIYRRNGMGKKYDSFATQREKCRNNGYAYTEKIDLADGYKMPVLFCNYPFEDPSHKKGLCVAKTCTDLRKKPAPAPTQDADVPPEVLKADKEQETEALKSNCDKEDTTTLSDYNAEEGRGEETPPCDKPGTDYSGAGSMTDPGDVTELESVGG
jgi:hypothetical protein